MNDPLAVSRRQPGGGLHADANDLRQLERPFPVDPFLQRLARDVLHHQVRQAVGLFHRMDRDDMVVGHRGGGLGLAQEAFAGNAAGRQLGGQHLDGHDTMQGWIERLQHDPHPAPTDLGQHFIAFQPAQVLRLVRRAEESQRQVAGGHRLSRWSRLRVLVPFQAGDDLLQGRLQGWRRGQFPGQGGPGLLPGRQSFHAMLTGRADFQVGGQLPVLGRRQALCQEVLQPVHGGTGSGLGRKGLAEQPADSLLDQQAEGRPEKHQPRKGGEPLPVGGIIRGDGAEEQEQETQTGQQQGHHQRLAGDPACAIAVDDQVDRSPRKHQQEKEKESPAQTSPRIMVGMIRTEDGEEQEEGTQTDR